MKWHWLWGLGLLGLLAGAGCAKRLPAHAAVSDEEGPTRAQPRLATMKLWLGAQELEAELATNNTELMTGMMFRTNMAENEGMLFVFPYPYQASFWMKNTYLPLSAAYIDPDGIILEIHALKPLDTNAVVAASSRIQFVLETKQGWFKRHHIGIGTMIRTEKGSLQQTFFGHP